MKTKNLMMLIAAFVVSTTAAFGYDYDYDYDYNYDFDGKRTISLRKRDIYVYEGTTKTVRLPGKMFVHKLLIQAVSGSRRDAYGEVLVNGDVKGTLYLPGNDPHYTVTVAEEASSVQFTSQDNTMKIISIKAVVTDFNEIGDYFIDAFDGSYRTVVGATSARILALVDRLEDYAHYKDYGTYLLPIKKSAVKALAVAESYGDASEYARRYYASLLKSVDMAQGYLKYEVESDMASRLVVQLMMECERLRRILQ